MKTLLLFLALAASALAQTRWSMTTGNLALSAAGTAVTIQQPSSGAQEVVIENAVVYCSVACTVSFAANGTAATTTAGTVRALLPALMTTPAPFNFFTASNVGAGTAQGGVINIPAGGTTTVCFGTSGSGCAATNTANYTLPAGGTGTNFTVSIASLTGTVNITLFARTN